MERFWGVLGCFSWEKAFWGLELQVFYVGSRVLGSRGLKVASGALLAAMGLISRKVFFLEDTGFRV